jgi:hypothetical protein
MSAGGQEFDKTKIYKCHYTILGHFLGKSEIEKIQMGEKIFFKPANYVFEFKTISPSELEWERKNIVEASQEEYRQRLEEENLIEDSEIQFNKVYNLKVLQNRNFKESELIGKNISLTCDDNTLVTGTIVNCIIKFDHAPSGPREERRIVPGTLYSIDVKEAQDVNSKMYYVYNLRNNWSLQPTFSSLTFLSQGGKLKSKRKMSRKLKKTKRKRNRK